MAKFVTLIAGNICAGKTRLINHIKDNHHQFQEFLASSEIVKTVPEFIDPIALKLFYSDRQNNSAIFEDSCLSGRIVRHLDAKGDHNSNLYFFDRGMIEGAETFCLNSLEEQCISSSDYQEYISCLNRNLNRLDRTKQQNWLEQLIVYLEVSDVKILQERQKSRGTTNEIIPQQYLERINDKYNTFFNNLTSTYHKYGVEPPQLLRIDASQDINQNPQYYQQTLFKIIETIKEMNINGKR